MSKPVNKTLIGVFVLGAATLIVIAVLIFGSGKFFAPTKKFVMVFEGSVKGLNVGAPVIFRGVKVGEVTEIKLRFDPRSLTGVIPVYVEIDQRTFTVPEEFKAMIKESGKKYLFIQPLIKKGLRAQLQMQSFVTGQLMINLDFYPNQPIKLARVDTRYPEIPTIPTSMEELTKTLQDLKLEELFKKIASTTEGIEKLVNSPEMKGSLASLNQTMKDADKLVVNLDGRIGPLVADLRGMSENARGALASIERSFSMEHGIPVQIGETMKRADKTLQQAEKTLATIQTTANDTNNVRYELNRTLREFSETARSLRILSDYLERHPEVILKGKSLPKGE